MRKLFFSFLLALVVPMVAGAQEKEMYAVYDEDAKTFTFYYDKYRDKRDGKVYDLARKGAGGNSKWGTLWNNADWMKNIDRQENSQTSGQEINMTSPQLVTPTSKSWRDRLGDAVEEVLRVIQLTYMRRKITREYLSPTQIFFHPLERNTKPQTEEIVK